MPKTLKRPFAPNGAEREGEAARGFHFLRSAFSVRDLMAMLSAYFDTNPFDNLLKLNQLTASDLAELRAAIQTGKLAVVSNILNIQETIDALHSKTPQVVVPQLDLIAGLIDWGRFVKPCDMLLADDIRHFAWCGEASSPFLRESDVTVIHNAVNDIIRGRIPMAELDGVVRENSRQKTAFAIGLENDHAQTASMVEQIAAEGPIPDFPAVFAIAAQDFAYHTAAKVGRAEECKSRGLERFLSVQSVRMAVGLGLSVTYRRAFENKKLKRPLGASRDLQHLACAAAAADVFVTHDRELTSLACRVPIHGFRILTLRQLLAELSEGDREPEAARAGA